MGAKVQRCTEVTQPSAVRQAVLTLCYRKFKIFKVSVNFTVKMVIENVLRKDGDACKGWAATEAVEIGGGKWAKVCSFMLEGLENVLTWSGVYYRI